MDKMTFYDSSGIKTIYMDRSDVSDRLQAVLDEEDTAAVILTGSGTIKKQVTVKRKCSIHGVGASVFVEGDIEAIRFETGGIHINGIDFYAGGNSDGYEKQCAVDIGNTLDNSISDCRFEGFGACALIHRAACDKHQGNHISNCTFNKNAIGFAAFERAEYNQLTQCTFYENETAVHIEGGNTNISGCIISDNVTGVKILPGDNHAHGVITGCSINHNKVPFYVKDVYYGFIISGCPVYCGDVVMENSRYIKFYNCDMSQIIFKLKSCKNILVSGGHLIKYEVSGSNGDGTGLIFTNCLKGYYDEDGEIFGE